MRSFKRKPYVVSAIRYDGTEDNGRLIMEAVAKNSGELRKARIGESGKQLWEVIFPGIRSHLFLEEGDWLIHGPEGEWQVCADDLFHQTYEEA